MAAQTPVDVVNSLVVSSEYDFGVDEVETAMNRNADFVTEILTPRASVLDEALAYLVFEARGFAHWDSDVVLYDGLLAELTPTTSELIRGRWTLSSEPTFPVRAIGLSYDVYAAAAELLESRAAQLAEEEEAFSGQNGAFNFSPKHKALLTVAAQYRTQQRIASGQLLREDMAR